MSEMRISTRICPFFSTPTTELADTIPQKLVIAGGDESLRTLDERIDQRTSSLGDRVEVTGRLRFDTLRALIAGADLLIMPSSHEGAGLPPLAHVTNRQSGISPAAAADAICAELEGGHPVTYMRISRRNRAFGHSRANSATTCSDPAISLSRS